MAEEKEKEGLQTDTGNTDDAGKTGGDDSQKDGTPSETEKDVNWEERYKELQTAHTQASQEAAELRTRVEQLEQPPEEPEGDLDNGDGFLDRKTAEKIIDARVDQKVNALRREAADRYFHKTYPEMVEFENAIAGIMRNPKKPLSKGVSLEERIDAAVKEYSNQTETQKATAKAEAEAAAKAQEEAKRKASGLGSTATSTPPSDEGEISDEQELKNRRTQSAKRRGLA